MAGCSCPSTYTSFHSEWPANRGGSVGLTERLRRVRRIDPSRIRQKLRYPVDGSTMQEFYAGGLEYKRNEFV